MKALTAVILAAGDSKRMRSKLPKALHRVSGRPLVDYPVRLGRALGARVVLVIGHGASEVRAAVGDAKDRMVCPALVPPWHRAVTSDCPDSRSVALPLPSSPHWVPTRIVAGTARFYRPGAAGRS